MTVRTKFDWTLLSAKPDAIDILSKNLDKINWAILSLNPAAIHILKDKGDVQYVHNWESL
jgi:hypothetical protein